VSERKRGERTGRITEKRNEGKISDEEEKSEKEREALTESRKVRYWEQYTSTEIEKKKEQVSGQEGEEHARFPAGRLGRLERHDVDEPSERELLTFSTLQEPPRQAARASLLSISHSSAECKFGKRKAWKSQ